MAEVPPPGVRAQPVTDASRVATYKNPSKGIGDVVANLSPTSLRQIVADFFVGRSTVEVRIGALNRENPGSNPLPAVSKLSQFRSSHVATIHSAV